jgi:hypothetical protein
MFIAGAFGGALLVGGLSILAGSGPSDEIRCGEEVMVPGKYCVRVPARTEPGPGLITSGDSYGEMLAEARDGDEFGQGLGRMIIFLAGVVLLGALVASLRLAWKRRRAVRAPVRTDWPSSTWYPGWPAERR